MKAILTRSIALGALAGGLAFPTSAVLAETQAQPGAEAEDLETSLNDENRIVVTAQGRTQELVDVPVAINVVSGQDLLNSGAADIRDLNQLAPSLLVSSTGNEANGSARIRGIGTVGDNPGLESSVAVFIDGVYRSRSGNALSELGPIDRIEVLRGPQGTLGGRNTSAGLINIYTAPPEFDFSGYGAFTYGNFDAIRVEAGINVPLGDTVAARVDGVYFKRDGFYEDQVNNITVNDRDRFLIRGQLLFEPTDAVSIRLTGDYTKREEACCAATFVQSSFAPGAAISPGLDPFTRPLNGPPLTSGVNPIVPVLLGLGQNPAALNQSTFNRDIYPTAGRTYAGETEDWGVSLEANWDLGDAQLTWITGFRRFENFQASDTDYTGVDILYRGPGQNAGARQFETFTQEIRLQGEAFDGTLDWLVGGFFANEQLQVRDNLRFGTQYGTFASCRIVLAINPALVNTAAPNCLGAGAGALTAANMGAGAFGPATPLILGGLNNLGGLSNLGSTVDIYNQDSTNFALFTHNIINFTDQFSLTLGLRYTNETKEFDATFGNDNVVCPANRALLSGLLGTPALAGLAGGLIALSCQGNSTAELNGRSINDDRDEDEFTGTAILTFKPSDRVLTYLSYSRGYKAGGFNLDRSSLSNPLFLNVNALNPALLQFEEETVDAFEFGAKVDGRNWTLTMAAFHQEFTNFQLNTFNGSVFVVQNVNSCGTGLGGADRDTSAATGACAPTDVQPGVTTSGIEMELSVRPARYLNTNFGMTYANTRYENDLIGNDTGAPLDPALRLLPGDQLSNAPEWVGTASVTYTPPIGNTGLSALFFLNARITDDFNTGSDLLFGKEQDSFTVVNGRVGIRGPDERWAIELWAVNLFNEDFTQIAFNTPFIAPQQTFSAFLAEPRTYGITVRAGF